MATQVLTDGSVEGATPFTSWVPAGGVALTQGTGSADNGTKYGISTVTGTGSKVWTTPVAEGLSGLTTGQVVSVGAAIKTSSDGSNIAVGLRFWNTAHTSSTDLKPARTTPTGAWVRRTYSAATPAGFTKAEVLFDTATGLTGRTYTFDSVVLIAQSYAGGYLAFGASPPAATGPDWIVIDLDDAATEDMDRVPEFAALAAQGISFTNYYMTDPSCSPSRASFMTGTNACNNKIPNINDATAAWISGGWGALSLATKWSAAGGQAHILGKFLHESAAADPTWFPSGFMSGRISDVVYRQFACEERILSGGVVSFATTGTSEAAYLTDDLASDAVAIIAGQAAGIPLHVYFTPGNNHGNHGEDPDTVGDPTSSAAPRHRPIPTGAQVALWSTLGWNAAAGGTNGDCGTTSCTALGPFYTAGLPWNNVQMANAPGWHDPTTKGSGGLDKAQERNRDRVRSLQSVGEALTTILAALVTAGRTAYVVLNSDNGWHDAQWCQPPSKGALYPTDTRVKMVIVPPGGVSPRVVDDFVTHADLYPTMLETIGAAIPSHVDGLSLMPIITNDAGRAKRKRVPLRFRTNKTWDELLESGQPAPSDGITGLDPSGNQVLFISYEPEAVIAPPDEKGQFHILTGPDADPYLMNNRYAELTLACRTAYMAELVATRAATAATARSIALTALPAYELSSTPSFDYDPDKYLIGDLDVMTYAHTVQMLESTGPGRRGSNTYNLGWEGSTPELDTLEEEAEFTLRMIVQGANADGTWPSNPAAVDVVRDNMDTLARNLNPGIYRGLTSTDGLIPQQHMFRDGQWREARTQISKPIPVIYGDRYLAALDLPVTIPEGCWRDLERIDSGHVLLGWNGGARTGLVQFLTHTGGSHPIQDGIVTLHGTMPGPIKVYDKLEQTGIKYSGSLSSTQRLELDFGNKKARLYATDADATGTNVRADVTRLAGSGRCWVRLHPSPNNARYSVYLELGGAPSIDSWASLLAARRFTCLVGGN